MNQPRTTWKKIYAQSGIYFCGIFPIGKQILPTEMRVQILLINAVKEYIFCLLITLYARHHNVLWSLGNVVGVTLTVCRKPYTQMSVPCQIPDRIRYKIETSTVYWCIASKLKAPWNFYWMSNMFLWVEIFLFFVCYHVVPKRHSQLDYELNGL